MEKVLDGGLTTLAASSSSLPVVFLLAFFPNKCIACLIPSWYPLLGEPELIQRKREQVKGVHFPASFLVGPQGGSSYDVALFDS